jgi:quaternary ammonium compound-resistance protein SugE
MAQKEIPMGTSYAVWTSIGAVGTFVVGIVFYNDANLWIRWLGVFLILSGVVCLKMGHSA